MRLAFSDDPEFRRLLAGDPDADLTRIALEIARDADPGLDPEHYLGLLDALAERVRDRCPPGARPRHVLGQINWVLFVEEGFRGNVEDYYDPRNSYLDEVIDRRLGIPISLGILYLAVADRIGFPMAGVNLPMHFLVRTLTGTQPIFVDPFHTGLLLDPAGCARRVSELMGREVALSDADLAPCPAPVLVARMLRNLKAVYLRNQEYPAAAKVLRRLVALSPEVPRERRDLGVTLMNAGRSGEAIDHLRAYLEAEPASDDADAIRSLIRAAWRDVGETN